MRVAHAALGNETCSTRIVSANAALIASRAHLLDPVNRDPGRPGLRSYPAFANKCIYARNGKEIVCVSLAVE